MALIDVTDILVDPDFVNEIQIIRRVASVNNLGENQVNESEPIITVGSVQPASQKDIIRLPEAMRLKDLRSFWVRGEIKAGGVYPDILVFANKRFQVFAVEPWDNYGSGWNRGLCVAEEIS